MDTLYDKKQSYPFDYFFEESSKNKMNLEPNSKVVVNGRGLEYDSDSSSISSGDEEGSESDDEEQPTTNQSLPT